MYTRPYLHTFPQNSHYSNQATAVTWCGVTWCGEVFAVKSLAISGVASTSVGSFEFASVFFTAVFHHTARTLPADRPQPLPYIALVSRCRDLFILGRGAKPNSERPPPYVLTGGNVSTFLEQVMAVAKPVLRWGIMPAVLLMGMRSEPSPTLLEVLYPL